MEIYISRSGERYGPYTLAEVQADLDAGNTLATDLAWHEGAAGWSEVSQLEGVTIPKRRVPPPPPPLPPQAAPASSVPQKSSGAEMALLILLTALLPVIGLVIGIIRISKPERRSEGGILLAISIGLMMLYLAIF